MGIKANKHRGRNRYHGRGKKAGRGAGKRGGRGNAGMNKHSIGICYIGGMDKNMDLWLDTRTPEQKDALFNLLMDLKFQYPEAVVYGHNDFTDKKVCPCFDAFKEYREISNYTE